MSHGAFFQTNTEMAERLYGVATEFAGLSGRERVFDLFCGIGTIGLTMAGDAGEVWGLEIVPEAIDDAERNAHTQRDRERQVRRRQRPHRSAAADREGRQARRRRRRSAPRRPLPENRPPADRVRGEADRLRLLQPDDAGAERQTARGGRLQAAPRATGRHVPADPAHRVRGAVRAGRTERRRRRASAGTEAATDGAEDDVAWASRPPRAALPRTCRSPIRTPAGTPPDGPRLRRHRRPRSSGLRAAGRAGGRARLRRRSGRTTTRP